MGQTVHCAALLVRLHEVYSMGESANKEMETTTKPRYRHLFPSPTTPPISPERKKIYDSTMSILMRQNGNEEVDSNEASETDSEVGDDSDPDEEAM